MLKSLMNLMYRLMGQHKRYGREFNEQRHEAKREYLTSMAAAERSDALAGMAEKRLVRLRIELEEAKAEALQDGRPKSGAFSWVSIQELIVDQINTARMELLKERANAEQHLVLAQMYKGRASRLNTEQLVESFVAIENKSTKALPASFAESKIYGNGIEAAESQERPANTPMFGQARMAG